MAFTVIPLNNLLIPNGSVIPFGKTFVLQDVPKWVKQEEATAPFSRHAVREILAANHALVAEYQASAMGEPDPEWAGSRPRSIQECRFQAAYLANFAIWLEVPSKLCFTLGLHALTKVEGGNVSDAPFVLGTERADPFYCYPREEGNIVTLDHLKRAANFYGLLETIPRGNPVWAALRAFSGSLRSYYAEYRYPLFWQGLESLFGSENEWYGINKRLRNRISYFLADDATSQKEISEIVEDCYRVRGEIVHGRQAIDSNCDDEKMEEAMERTENIVRTVVRHILQKPDLLAVLLSSWRDEYLEKWVTSKMFSPPPMQPWSTAQKRRSAAFSN
jgi:Apea-like HEPN